MAWTQGRVGGLAPAVRAASQSPVGSAAEDPQHSRKSGSQRDAPSLPVWKLEWSRVWVPGGMEFNATKSRCRKGVDIPLLNVGAFGFRPPPVGQVQQLQSEKRSMARHVGGSVEITQEVSALASVGPLKRCGVRLRPLMCVCCALLCRRGVVGMSLSLLQQVLPRMPGFGCEVTLSSSALMSRRIIST